MGDFGRSSGAVEMHVRVTPATAASVTDRAWGVEEYRALVEAEEQRIKNESVALWLSSRA